MMASNNFMVERKTKGNIVTENSEKYGKTNSGSEKGSLKTVDESGFFIHRKKKAEENIKE